MKKNIFRILFSIILLFLFVGNINADTAVDYSMSINYSNSDNRTIIGGFYYLPSSNLDDADLVTWFKVSPENKILYCSDGKSGSIAADSGTYTWNLNCIKITGDRSRSLAYVYENGYNTYTKDCSATEYLVGTYDQDYFITQTAAWYFTSKPSWMDNFDASTGNFFGQSNDFTKKISKLITDAETAGKEGPKINISVSNTKMSLTSDGKYYISNAITLSGKYLNSNITATASGASGAFVTTNKDATSGTNSFASGSTVYVKVPASSVTSTVTVSLSTSATSALGEGNIIQCEINRTGVQSMIEYTPNNVTVSANTNLTATVSKFSVNISKQDITTSKEVSGAKLSLKSGTTEIAFWTSGTTPYTVSLEQGTYTLTETTAPKGYKKKTTSIVFTIDQSGKIHVDGKEVSKVVMTNDPIMILISKKDITQANEVSGATLRITDKNGNVVKDIEGNNLEWISTSDPKKIHIASGTYILEETIAPAGYKKETTTIEFTVDENGKVLVEDKEVSEVTMINELITVSISKRSITGSKELSGAKLKIQDKDGNTATDINGNLLEWTSSESAKVINLVAGTYTLVEIIAPEGYELSEATIEFTVTDEGKVLVDGKEVKDNLIIFENTPEPETVPTGSAVLYIVITLGAVALGVATYFIIKKYKK